MTRSVLVATVGTFIGSLVACGPVNTTRKICDGDSFANEPELCIDRTALGFSQEFGSGTTLGTRPIDSIKITNRGLKPLTITGVVYTGEPEFKVKASWDENPDDAELPPTTVTGGKRVFLQVEFTPRQARSYSGSIALSSNASNEANRTVQLSGCGVPADGGFSNCYSCDVIAQGCSAAVDGGPRACYQSPSGASFCSFTTGVTPLAQPCDAPASCEQGLVCLTVCQQFADGGRCTQTAEARCQKPCNVDGGAPGCGGRACLELTAQGIRNYGACAL